MLGELATLLRLRQVQLELEREHAVVGLLRVKLEYAERRRTSAEEVAKLASSHQESTERAWQEVRLLRGALRELEDRGHRLRGHAEALGDENDQLREQLADADATISDLRESFNWRDKYQDLLDRLGQLVRDEENAALPF